MVKQKLAITGDWNEGIDLASDALSGSPFEPLPVKLLDIKNVLKSKSSDAILFCVNELSPEISARISEIKRINDVYPIFLFTKTTEVDRIVRLIKSGINDCFVRPLDKPKFIDSIEREVRLYQLTQKVFRTATNTEEYMFEGMIGISRGMQDSFQMIAAVAKSNATVLITGESGVGKELVAKAIHKRSERSEQKFVDINCGAIPRDLLENELFGHEKGSFTGAHKRYLGSFEVANKGSLFLDEISEMDVSLQVKLLRALQERTITRIGSNDQIKIDVRIMAATNRSLSQMIEDGRFREDLFYRLNVVNIDIPSLRERRDDIPLLARHFLEYYSAKNNKIFLDFANDAMEVLINHDWPGNVRELENTIERIVVLHDSSQVKIKHLPSNLQQIERPIVYSDQIAAAPSESSIIPLEDLERQAIEAAMIKYQGNVGVVAKKLKIGQATLYRKVKKFGLQ